MLVGWDGAQRSHVRESLGRRELPSLQKLVSEGALVDIDCSGHTDTKAGWAEILTGYSPGVTGVFNNRRYQSIPRGYTVFEQLKKFFGPGNFIAVAVIGKNQHLDADPPYRKLISKQEGLTLRKKFGFNNIVVEDGKEYLLFPGKPYYYTKDSLDVFINGLGEDAKVGAKTLELLEKYKDKPFFFFVHFARVDGDGHRYGENSKEYNDALVSADTWLGTIIQKLKDLNIYDKTLIYVTADHGFDEGLKTHCNAPYVFLATNDAKVMRPGERKDIAATILARFGLNVNALDGRSLTESCK